MITKEQLEAQIAVTADKPVKGLVLVARYVIKETSEKGVYKGSTATPEEVLEQKKLYVVAVSEDDTIRFKPTDIIKAQRYGNGSDSATDIPSIIDGYEIGYVRVMDVLTYREFN